MKKVHNFYAGPSILPDFTYQETIKAIQDFEGTGVSLMSVSHRSKEYEAIILEARNLFKELIGAGDDYTVLYLGGGASLQFAMVPMNFLKTKAFYLNTGTWASKALAEAKLFGEVEVVSSKDKNFSYIPKGYTIPKDADYFHFTSNNTIAGTEIRHDLDSPIPLICDMSSDMFSRKVDVSKYAMIYGGAQKNLGPAGVTFVIVKNDFMKSIANRVIPTMLNYNTHAENDSMFNTPPAMNIFATLQTLKWIKNIGGLEEIERRNVEKAKILYDAIDNSKLFEGTVEKEDRSIMNVCFVMKQQYKALEPDFMTYAKSLNMLGIAGHRSVGGYRASLYNALPKESVIALVDAMKEFESKH